MSLQLLDKASKVLIVCIYVDDGLVIGNCEKVMNECIEYLKSRFEITTNEPETFVGSQIEKDLGGNIVMCQSNYIRKMLQKFGMELSNSNRTPIQSNIKVCKSGIKGVASKSVSVPYRQLIGSLLYASMLTRPDISYSVNVVSRYCEDPKLAHWKLAKNILKYLVGREGMGLCCKRSNELKIECYTDSDFAGCIDTRRSTSGWVISLNSTPIIWKSTRQTITATSTCKAEFVAASTAAKDILWLRNILCELKLNLDPTPMFVDNQGTIKLIKNDQVHAKTKHLDIKLHFIRD